MIVARAHKRVSSEKDWKHLNTFERESARPERGCAHPRGTFFCPPSSATANGGLVRTDAGGAAFQGGQGEPAAARGAGAARGESDPQIPLGRRPWRRRRRVRGRRRSPRPHGQGRWRWQDARVTACARRARGAGPQHRCHTRHTHHARWPSRRQGLPPPSPGSTAWRVGERGDPGLRDALCTKRCGPHLGSGGRPAHPQNAASPIWDRGVALSTVTSGRGVTVHTQLLSGLASGLHSGHSRGIGGSYAAEDGGPGLRGRSRNTAAAHENAARAPRLSPSPRGLTVSAVLGPLRGRERKTRPKLCPPEGRAFCGQHAKSE